MKGKKARVKDNAAGVCDLDKGFVIEGSPSCSEKCILLAKNSRYFQLLIGLTAIGFFLRFYNLTFNSIWLDEAATYTFANNSLAEIWSITAQGEYNPPLFNWIEHFMLFFGNNELTLRFIPALLGTLTVPLFYILGKEFFDRNAGIIAAAVLAFSPFHLFYSQDARAYTTVLFFYSLALIFLLKGLKTENRLYWILFGIFSALSFWTHFYVFIAVLVLYLYAIYFVGTKKGWNYKAFTSWILSVVVFLIVTLPLLIVTFHLFLVRTTGSPPTYGVQGFQTVILTLNQFSGFNIYLNVLFLILFVIGLIQLFIVRKNSFILIIMVLLITFSTTYALSYVMPFIPRHLFFLLPFFFIPVASSYHIFFRITKTPKIVYAFIILIMVINAPQLYAYNTAYSKEDWRGLSQNLQQATQPGDVVVAVPVYINMPLEYYYNNNTDRTIVTGASDLQALQAVSVEYQNATVFYLVTSDIMATDPSGASLQWLKANTQFAGDKGGIFVFVTNNRI